MLHSKLIVNSDTNLCCLIGDPVIQSPSPEIHNASFKASNLNYIYLSFRVIKEDLKTAIDGLRTLGVKGFNITIPHKEAALELVDEVDSISADIGAINTVVNKKGKLVGVNSDVEGFIYPLKEKSIIIKNNKSMILGAGGAARACIAALINEGCNDLVILNRDPKRATDMVSHLQKKFVFNANIGVLNRENISKFIGDVDLIVNTTSIGMYPHVGVSPIPKNFLRSNQIIYDIVYKPIKTKLIEQAENAGATVICGYEMLVNQAAISFNLWTNSDPHKSMMRRTALQILGV